MRSYGQISVSRLIVSVLNAIAIARFLHYRQEWKRTFLIPVIVSIIMGAAAYLVYQLFHLVFGSVRPPVLFAILAGVATYGIGLISFKGITVEEIAALPKGHLIVRAGAEKDRTRTRTVEDWRDPA